MLGIKTAKKVEELSTALVVQSKKHLDEINSIQAKLVETNNLQLKTARETFLNSFTNFNTQIFPHYNVIKEQIIFQTMDDIYSVVSRLAATAAMIPFYGEDSKGQELGPKDKLSQFLSTLTFEQKERFYTTLFLQGEIFAYKEVLDVGVNAGLVRLRYLNPSKMIVIISQTFPTEIVGYRYYDSYNGFSKDFDVEEIFFVKTFNPTFDIQKEFRGLSATTVLKSRLTRVQAGLDVSIAQMQNGGVPGVMYEKQIMEKGAMGQRQDNFAKFLNNTSNKGAPYMLNGDVGYFAIGSALADMSLAELSDIDFDKICNAFSVSSIIFNNHKASIKSNMEQVIKGLYTNAVLPQVIRFQDGLNEQCLPDIRTAGTICYDISDVTELQGDLKNKADAIAAMPIFMPNDAIAAMGGQKSDDPLMDKWYMKTGYTPIDEVSMSLDVLPNVAGDYQQPGANGQPAVDANDKPVKIPAATTAVPLPSANGKNHKKEVVYE